MSLLAIGAARRGLEVDARVLGVLERRAKRPDLRGLRRAATRLTLIAGTMRLFGRVVLIFTGLVVGAIVLAILLVVLEANLDNPVASILHSVAEWLVTPFKALFTLKQQKTQVAVNWGVAAIVYLVVGLLIARLVGAARPALPGASGAGRSATPVSKDLMPPT